MYEAQVLCVLNENTNNLNKQARGQLVGYNVMTCFPLVVLASCGFFYCLWRDRRLSAVCVEWNTDNLSKQAGSPLVGYYVLTCFPFVVGASGGVLDGLWRDKKESERPITDSCRQWLPVPSRTDLQPPPSHFGGRLWLWRKWTVHFFFLGGKGVGWGGLGCGGITITILIFISVPVSLSVSFCPLSLLPLFSLSVSVSLFVSLSSFQFLSPSQ